MSIAGELVSLEFGQQNSQLGREATEYTSPPPLVLTTSVAEVVTVIHSSRLFRDCLRRALSAATGATVLDYPDAQAWRANAEATPKSIILVGLSRFNPDNEANLPLILSSANGASVVVTGESEDPEYILDLLARGVRGYIPDSLALDVSIGALQIVRAGGVFVPANCLLSMPRHSSPVPRQQKLGMFTAKQVAVIEAIRKGKANKTIAYELNMCESTVKVHVRNIMKKMQATNRTQVAFFANRILSEKAEGDRAHSLRF
jgi:DNA-binding NarL/FixJ family response regulator